MAWVKFEAARVKRLEKFYEFRREMGWSVVEALGFLGSFWGEAIEVCESGDVTGWTPGFLSELTGLNGPVSERVWAALAKHGWLDRREERVLIHDWVDAAGPFLRGKYSGDENGRKKLVAIWALHGLQYGVTDKKPTGYRQETDRKPSVDKTRPEQMSLDHGTDGRAPARAAAQQFKPPTIAEVTAYCLERKNGVDAQRFIDHYEARGWKPKGYTTQMRDWKAAVRTWEKPGPGGPAPRAGKVDAAAGKYAGIGERHDLA